MFVEKFDNPVDICADCDVLTSLVGVATIGCCHILHMVALTAQSSVFQWQGSVGHRETRFIGSLSSCVNKMFFFYYEFMLANNMLDFRHTEIF